MAYIKDDFKQGDQVSIEVKLGNSSARYLGRNVFQVTSKEQAGAEKEVKNMIASGLEPRIYADKVKITSRQKSGATTLYLGVYIGQ